MERAPIGIPSNAADGAYGSWQESTGAISIRCPIRSLARLEAAEAMGLVGRIDSELAAHFHRVVGALVRLS
jgi:hypothetical protein